MRKITSLLTLLLLFVAGTAMAAVTQPTLTTDASNPTYYAIKNYRSGKFANYVDATSQLTQTSDLSTNSLWYFEANGDGVSMVSAADPTLKLASTSSATSTGSVWYLVENPYNAGYFCVSLTSGATGNCFDDQSGKIGYWQPSSGDYAGTSWIIQEVPVTKSEIESGSTAFAFKKFSVLNKIAPLSSLSTYASTVANVNNATTEAQINTALEALNVGITLFCNNSSKYLVVGASAGSYEASPTDYNHYIQLVSAGDGAFYLKGFKSEKYMGDVSTSTAINTDASPTTAFYIETFNNKTVACPVGKSGGYQYIHNGGSGCVGWSADAANTQFTMTEVTLPSSFVNVTYHLMLNGSDVAQQTVEMGIGDAPSAPFSYDFTTFTYDVTTITASTTDVYATATFNMPFTTSTDYANATWYFMNGHASYSDRYISTNGDATVWAVGNERTDAYKWAFIGNPIEGIKLINKAAGDGKYLQATDPATMGTTEKAWTLKKQTTTSWQSGANGFGLYDASLTYLNTQAGTLKYWNSFDQGSTYWVTEAPAATVNVTYELYAGGSLVNTVVDQNVATNSDVSIPASLISDYSTLAWDITTSGTIGESDCTITVTATQKAGVVTALSQLSNSKAYTLTTARGALGTNGTQMVSTHETSYTASNFAIISFESNYYLYSVADNKFVANTTQPVLMDNNDLSNIAALVLDDANATATSPLFFMGMGSNGVNIASGYGTGIVVNSWTTRDKGNQYCIIEADDFDATAALAVLDEAINGPTAFAAAIAELKAINWGRGVNQYSLTGSYAGFAGNEAALIAQLETEGYTAANLAGARDLLANYALNMPAAGFYRIKGNTSNMYLASGNASNGKYNMTSATDETTVFGFDGTHLINYGSGLANGMSQTSWDWVTGDANASTVEFQDGLTNGGYGIKSATCFFYDNGDNSASADRGANLTISTSTNARYTSWYLEEVTDLSLTLNDGGDGVYYATLALPVAVTLPAEVTAYTLSLDEVKGVAAVSSLGQEVPAGTAVLLKGSVANATATIDKTSTATAVTNALKPAYTGMATLDPDTQLSLGKADGKVGFYKYTYAVKGFRAYLEVPAGSAARGFALSFDDDVTGISAVNASVLNGAAVYDLQGRRVNNAAKGVYIVNGKKVLVK